MFQKLERSSTKGYQLFNLGSHWEMHSARGIYRGDMRQVMTYSVIQLGFSIKELEVAVEQMEEMFHDAAEFGVFGGFMYTFDRNVKGLIH